MHYRRVIIPGATYFFTINLLNRKSNLLVEHVDKLRYSFQRIKKLHPFIIDGIVIMPDHLHAMITLPSGDADYSLRIRLIKSLFSYQIKSCEPINLSRKRKNERGIWQRRFWEHLIRDELDYEKHLNYIHYNPVKHRYTSVPTSWPYSSIHRYIESGDLPLDWAGKIESYTEDFGE